MFRDEDDKWVNHSICLCGKHQSQTSQILYGSVVGCVMREMQ